MLGRTAETAPQQCRHQWGWLDLQWTIHRGLLSCLLGLPRAAHSRRQLFANAALAASRVAASATVGKR